MFFSGVLGWPPSVLMQEDVCDLADVYEGFARFNGLLAKDIAPPPSQFLSEMTKKFPDPEGAKS